jgi:hypothetical protein
MEELTNANLDRINPKFKTYYRSNISRHIHTFTSFIIGFILYWPLISSFSYVYNDSLHSFLEAGFCLGDFGTTHHFYRKDKITLADPTFPIITTSTMDANIPPLLIQLAKCQRLRELAS